MSYSENSNLPSFSSSVHCQSTYKLVGNKQKLILKLFIKLDENALGSFLNASVYSIELNNVQTIIYCIYCIN